MAIPERANDFAHPTNVSSERVDAWKAKLAKNMRIYREAFGITQEELAGLIGAKVSAISNWETGTRIPRPEWLISYSQVFGLPVGAMMGGDTPRFEKDEEAAGRAFKYNLKKYRERAGITQKEMAEKLDMKLEFYKKVEGDKKGDRLYGKELIIAKDVLGVELADLYEEPPKKKKRKA